MNRKCTVRSGTAVTTLWAIKNETLLFFFDNSDKY